MINLLDIAHLCSLVYKINETITEFKPTNNDEDLLFSKIIKHIIFLEDKPYSSRCIITKTNNLQTLIITIRGSDSIQDWVENIDILQIHPDNPNNIIDSSIKFHSGFYKQYKALNSKISLIVDEFKTDGGKEIILSGHSLGSAVCSIIAFHLKMSMGWVGKIKVVAIGCPEFCNNAGIEWFIENIPDYYRLVNYCDPVPNLPILRDLPNYKHIPAIVLLFKDGLVISNDSANEKSNITTYDYIKDIWYKKITISEHIMSKYISLIKAHKILFKLKL